MIFYSPRTNYSGVYEVIASLGKGEESVDNIKIFCYNMQFKLLPKFCLFIYKYCLHYLKWFLYHF